MLFWTLAIIFKAIWFILNNWIFKRQLKTFGQSAIANFHEIKSSSLFQRNRIFLGSLKTGLFGNKPIFTAGEGHVAVVAPPRTRKGLFAVIPNILAWNGSLVIADPKGENYAITQRYRSKHSRAFAINFDNPSISDGFNPLSGIRLGDHRVADARELAALLVTSEPNESAHWVDKSREWLVGLILYVLERSTEAPQTLFEVRRIWRS